MPLSTFPTDMPVAAAAVLSAADKFRVIKSQGGALLWRTLEDAQNSLRAAKLTCLKAISEGQKQPEGAEVFMAQLGGPATLAEFGAALVQVEMAASAWNDFLEQFLAGLPTSDLIAVHRQDQGLPTETRHIIRPAAIQNADALRQSPQLAALISAFDAAGA